MLRLSEEPLFGVQIAETEVVTVLVQQSMTPMSAVADVTREWLFSEVCCYNLDPSKCSAIGLWLTAEATPKNFEATGSIHLGATFFLKPGETSGYVTFAANPPGCCVALKFGPRNDVE